MIVVYPLDFNGIPSPNFVLENRPEAVTNGRAGRLYFNTQTRLVEAWNGLRTLVLGAPSDAGAIPGSLALRDETGGLSATVFNGPVAGNAATASLAADAQLLDGKAPAYYRVRSNHTGLQPSATISDLPATIQATRLDQFALPLAPLNLNNLRLINLAEPETDSDAVTKRYVDNYLAFSTGLYLPYTVYDPAATGKVQYAVNSDLLSGTGPGYYLDRGHHSGVQLSSTISDFISRVRTVSLTALSAPNTNLSLGGFRIVSLGDPQEPFEAATKAYVDRTVASVSTAPQWNSIEGIPPLRKTFAPLPFRDVTDPAQTEACGYDQYFFSSVSGWRRMTSLPLRPWITDLSAATDPGQLGQTAYDSDNFYVCVAQNSWKKVTLESWGGNQPFGVTAPAPEGHTYCDGHHFYIATGTNSWKRFALTDFSGVPATDGVPTRSYYPGLPEFEATDSDHWYYCWNANQWARAALSTF